MIRANTARLVDRAPVRIIGHVSDNILSNLNQYRNLLYPDQELFFKPRYVLQGDELRFVHDGHSVEICDGASAR